MNDVLETAKHLQSFCDQRGWRSCVIGGIAVQRWGEPRVTRDVDLTVLTGFGGEDVYVDTLLAEFGPEEVFLIGGIGDAAPGALRARYRR